MLPAVRPCRLWLPAARVCRASRSWEWCPSVESIIRGPFSPLPRSWRRQPLGFLPLTGRLRPEGHALPRRASDGEVPGRLAESSYGHAFSLRTTAGPPGPPVWVGGGVWGGGRGGWGGGGARLGVGAAAVKPITAQLMSTPTEP